MSLTQIINELTVTNMEDSLEFYQKIFKFEVEFTYGKPEWVQLKKDNQRLMLEDYKTVVDEVKNFPPKTNTSNLIKFEYSNLEELKDVYHACKEAQCSLFIEYHETDYGKMEFGVLDPDKNMIIVSYEKIGSERE